MGDLVERLRRFQVEASDCARCSEHGLLFVEGVKRARPLFQADATGAARVLVVAEAPNDSDTFDPKKGRLTYAPDTDETGRFATKLLESVGLRIQDVLFTNAVLCLPARRNGRFPVRVEQMDLCGEWLNRLIVDADPLVVVTFGAHALRALDRVHPHRLRLREAVGQLHSWAGRRLLPLYHPGRLGRLSRTVEQQLADVAVLKSALLAGALHDEPLHTPR